MELGSGLLLSEYLDQELFSNSRESLRAWTPSTFKHRQLSVFSLGCCLPVQLAHEDSAPGAKLGCQQDILWPGKKVVGKEDPTKFLAAE